MTGRERYQLLIKQLPHAMAQLAAREFAVLALDELRLSLGYRSMKPGARRNSFLGYCERDVLLALKYPIADRPLVQSGLANLQQSIFYRGMTAGTRRYSHLGTCEQSLKSTISLLPAPAPPTPSPAPTPTPSPVGTYPAASPLWKRKLVVVVALSSFTGELRQAARAAGYSVLAVLLDAHEPRAQLDANKAELAHLRPELMRAGWTIVGWSPAYQPEQAEQAARLVWEQELAGWATNQEAWAEGANAWITPRWFDRWNAAGHPCPVLVSCLSSDTGNHARSFDYDVCLRNGATISPQVYGDNYPGLSVDAMRLSLAKARVPLTHVAPWFSVDSPPTPWDDYDNWTGGHGLWTGESLPAREWLARAA